MHSAYPTEAAQREHGHNAIYPEVEILPGTEVMTDIGDRHFIHVGNKESATVLIPQPTTDLDDPLVSYQTGPFDLSCSAPDASSARTGAHCGKRWSW